MEIIVTKKDKKQLKYFAIFFPLGIFCASVFFYLYLNHREKIEAQNIENAYIEGYKAGVEMRDKQYKEAIKDIKIEQFEKTQK